MGRGILALALTFGLCATGVDAFPQAPSDPEVAKGIQQVEQGDYDAAIFTLDSAARRLSADPKKSQELSEAYLYLGIAFLGKGHEAAAKAKFREAVKQIKDLTLSPDKFAPRVINLVEAAKAEAGATAAGAKPATAAAPAKKGGGSGKVLLIAGLGVAAAGGVALAAGGGGGGTSNGSPSGGTPCPPTSQNRSGTLVQPVDNGAELFGTAREDGPWTAQIEWNGPAPLPNVDLFVNEDATGNTLVTGALTVIDPSHSRRSAQWQGRAGVRYRIAAFLDEHAPAGVPYPYTMTISGCQQ
jgi:Tfp pilus assembly protein PilF